VYFRASRQHVERLPRQRGRKSLFKTFLANQLNQDYSMDTNNRITELEIKATHQEATIADLNEVIFSQQKTIDSLESRLLKMETEIKSLSSNIKNASEETPPPHY
jgi:SlyX protein